LKQRWKPEPNKKGPPLEKKGNPESPIKQDVAKSIMEETPRSGETTRGG